MYTDTQDFNVGKENLSKEFLFMLFERKKLVLSIFFPVLIISIGLAILLPSQYRSFAKFSLIVPQQLDPLRQERNSDYKNQTSRYLQEQKELIVSDDVLQRVANSIFPGMGSKDLDERLEKMRNNIEVTPPEGQSFDEASVFYVSYTGNDPKQTFDIAKRLIDNYVQVFDDLSRSRTSYSVDFFEEQSNRLQKEMVEKEKDLHDYETREALALVEIRSLDLQQSASELGPSALLTQFQRKHQDLQEELAGLKASIAGMESELKKGSIPALPPDMEQPGRALTVYKNKIAQLQIMMNEMKSQFAGDFQPLQQAAKELNLNLEGMRDELGRTIRAQKLSAQTIEARMQEIENIMGRLEERIKGTAMERSVYEQKRREYGLTKDAYVAALKEVEQARVANALANSKQYLTQVQEPALPMKPVKPDRLVIVILGFFAGAFLGMAAGVTVGYFDHTIRRPVDIEKFMNVPSLGSVPRVG